MAIVRRILAVVVGLALLFEAAATGFNIWTKHLSAPSGPSIPLWLVLPIPLILLVSGVLVLRGRFWPILLPIGYVLAMSLYLAATQSGPFTIPWPIGA